jgi:hypothetical protein
MPGRGGARFSTGGAGVLPVENRVHPGELHRRRRLPARARQARPRLPGRPSCAAPRRSRCGSANRAGSQPASSSGVRPVVDARRRKSAIGSGGDRSDGFACAGARCRARRPALPLWLPLANHSCVMVSQRLTQRIESSRWNGTAGSMASAPHDASAHFETIRTPADRWSYTVSVFQSVNPELSTLPNGTGSIPFGLGPG